MQPSNIPAECLVGLTVENGWFVKQMIHKTPNSTGGHFSTGYVVEKDGKSAYLKAVDFSSALQDPNQLKALQFQLEVFNFEKDLLELCKNEKLHKVVVPIDSGKVTVPGFPPIINTVHYIIFEMADGDIRKVYSFDRHDLYFVFSSLHNIAVGIKELHQINIAHQDIKPSNALVFNDKTKISDIGRASSKEKPFYYDDYQCPGDINYIAPEQNYGFRANNDFIDKFAADIYSFGSLFYFYFYNMPLSSIFQNEFKKMNFNMSTDFEADLPYWERAFDDIISATESDLYTILKPESCELIISMIKSLCSPDPRKRGHKKNIEHSLPQYSLERFITELDRLAKKAKFKLI